eukprot:1564516-Pleurochrysis_carterae.AAC.3
MGVLSEHVLLASVSAGRCCPCGGRVHSLAALAQPCCDHRAWRAHAASIARYKKIVPTPTNIRYNGIAARCVKMPWTKVNSKHAPANLSMSGTSPWASRTSPSQVCVARRKCELDARHVN